VSSFSDLENSLRFQTGVPSTFFRRCPSMSVELAKDLNAAKGFAALRAAKLSEYTDYCTIVKNIYIYIYIP